MTNGGAFDREASEAESLRTIAKGLELGINFLDTAWIYQVRSFSFLPTKHRYNNAIP